jgi:Ser/Thr protein kinase RdoA (MazF antagonist)
LRAADFEYAQMTADVIREGSEALKRYAHGDLAEIQRLSDLSRHLRAAGVPVPGCRVDHVQAALRLAWIQGPTMGQRLDETELRVGDLAAAMKLLRTLHRSEAFVLELPPFNPFRRTDRRLLEPWFKTLPVQLQVDCLLLRRTLGASPPAPGFAVIHGDFHVGQLLLELATQKWWMIDLDDAALGHIEADIANFCVNLATRNAASLDEFNVKMAKLFAKCSKVYEDSIDASRLDYYAACTLLRRALKFASRQDETDRINAMVQAGLERTL